ncbi:hypothetical protein ACFSYD_15140 [Paracoccus aerius]
MALRGLRQQGALSSRVLPSACRAALTALSSWALIVGSEAHCAARDCSAGAAVRPQGISSSAPC